MEHLRSNTDDDEITRPVLRDLDGLTVGRLREWLMQFPYDSEVWIGDGQGYSNRAVEAWKLNEEDVLIDRSQVVVPHDRSCC